MNSPEKFVSYFRDRHHWWCKPGSAIYKDLTAFALDQADSVDSADELYLIFCTLHGIKPKPEAATYPMPRFSHRPAHPEQPDTHATKRLVCYGGEPVGGAVLETTAHMGEKWHWSAFTGDKQNESGYADSLDEALPLIKEAALRTMERWPDLLDQRRELRLRAEAAHKSWRERHNK